MPSPTKSATLLLLLSSLILRSLAADPAADEAKNPVKLTPPSRHLLLALPEYKNLAPFTKADDYELNDVKARQLDAASNPLLDRAKSEDHGNFFDDFAIVFPQGATWFSHTSPALIHTENLCSAVAQTCLRPEVEFYKDYWHRTRPFGFAENGPTYLNNEKAPKVDTSLPSGHAALSMTLALIFADIAPPKYRGALIARACEIGDDRVLLGVHYPSDGDMGRDLARRVYEFVQIEPAYQDALKQAQGEFATALNAHAK